MSVAILPLLGAGGMALSAMAKAVQTLYGMAADLNEYLDQHILDMKGSENPTISRTGRILEMAKLGFGIGYITPVVIIAVGQLLLGNSLSAITTVATAATITNPVAMTCAAIGAIYYGWGALSDVEHDEILQKLSQGLEVGIELIKSMVGFIINKTKELLSSKNIDEIKSFIGSAAAVFGKRLGDVTHKLSDVASDTFDVFKKQGCLAMERTFEAATDARDNVALTAVKVGENVDTLKEKLGEAILMTKDAASGTFNTASAAVSESADCIHATLEKSISKLRQKEVKPSNYPNGVLDIANCTPAPELRAITSVHPIPSSGPSVRLGLNVPTEDSEL